MARSGGSACRARLGAADYTAPSSWLPASGRSGTKQRSGSSSQSQVRPALNLTNID